ncbi:MAG: PAS domain S-box protein [Spirochaetota bacterium]
MVSHDFSAPVDVHSNDEFELLASAMHYIAIDIQGIFDRFDQAVIDATEANMKLRDTLAYLSAIIETMADALLVTDTTGTIIRVNRTLLDMFRFKEDRVLDRSFHEVFAPDMIALIEQSWNCGKREVVSAEIRQHQYNPYGGKETYSPDKRCFGYSQDGSR